MSNKPNRSFSVWKRGRDQSLLGSIQLGPIAEPGVFIGNSKGSPGIVKLHYFVGKQSKGQRGENFPKVVPEAAALE